MPVVSPQPFEWVGLKLGGSLLTDKTRLESLREKDLQRIATEVASGARRLWRRGVGILVGHGSGSFGHMAATQAGYPEQRQQRSSVEAAALRLHGLVLEAFRAQDLSCCSVPPRSFLTTDNDEVSEVGETAEKAFAAMQTLEQVPVVFGDVVSDQRLGFSIVSTERVLEALVRRQPDEVRCQTLLWAGETPGVYDTQGVTVPSWIVGPQASPVNPSQVKLEGSRGADVTGGMIHRMALVSRLAELGVPSVLFDGREPGAIEAALVGEAVEGTRVFQEVLD